MVKPVIRDAQSDESTYFIMTDRYENGDTSNDFGGPVQLKNISGFSPSEIGWWHGGDFKGITKNLNTIKDLGFTSIWITPPVVQKAVQGDSAAYHGYWGVDFTTTDPRLGSEADFKELVSAAHRLNLKVIIDVVINHTADVI
jgi:glycosidase